MVEIQEMHYYCEMDEIVHVAPSPARNDSVRALSALQMIISRLGQLIVRRLTFFLASHRLENMRCARIMKNGVD